MKDRAWRLPMALWLATNAAYLLCVLAGWIFLHRSGFSTGLDPRPVPGTPYFLVYWQDRYSVWDAQWYEAIARHGYHWNPLRPGVQQDIAFFPFWPLLLRAVYRLVPHYGEAAAIALASAIALAALMAFDRLSRRLLPPRTAQFATLLYALFPAAHFTLQSYPVGIITLCVALALLALLDGKPLRALLIAGLGSAAGPLVVCAGFTAWLELVRQHRGRWNQPRVLALLLGAGMMGLSGILGFMIWQWLRFGDPFAFVAAQEAWDPGHGLAANLWRGSWMSLGLPDFWEALKNLYNAWSDGRAGRPMASFNDVQHIAQYASLGGLLLGAAAGQRRAPWFMGFFGVLALLTYVATNGAEHNGMAMMRLCYVSLPGFIGIAWLLRDRPRMAWGLLGASALMALAECFGSAIGCLVV